MADVRARGLTFHVQRLAGPDPAPDERQTVVFVHGLVMDNLSSWYFTVAAAAARAMDVVLYDLRGHGLSERPRVGYTIAEHAADLGALLDALGVTGHVHVVGNSIGGLIALAFAATEPQRVASLVLVDAHTGAAGFGDEMAATLSLEGDARDQKIAQSFQSWLGRYSARKRTRLAQSAEALVHGTTLAEDLRGEPPIDDARLRGIEAPVLALYGERSDVRARGEHLAHVLHHCDLRILPGCSHSVLWEATAAVRAAIVEWLARR